MNKPIPKPLASFDNTNTAAKYSGKTAAWASPEKVETRNVMGDKHALYIAALSRYLARYQGRATELLQQTVPISELLERFFQAVIEVVLQRFSRLEQRLDCDLAPAAREYAGYSLDNGAYWAGVYEWKPPVSILLLDSYSYDMSQV